MYNVEKRFFTIQDVLFEAPLSQVLSTIFLKQINHQKMFTVEQIHLAHGKVKSGADFPPYIQEIKALGVSDYHAYVSDGHIDYYGANNHVAKVLPKYETLEIEDISNSEAFKAELIAHQLGKTDFLTFIKMCAKFGIEKWEVNMHKMTCTYYDKVGNEILVEKIPE